MDQSLFNVYINDTAKLKSSTRVNALQKTTPNLSVDVDM